MEGNGLSVHKHQKNLEQALRRLGEEKGICPENKRLIASFSKNRLARGCGRLRIVKCIYSLRYLAKWLKKPFDKATKEELIELTGEIENYNYSENTKYDHKVVLKIFYKWLKGNDEEFPPEIKWLKPRLKNEAHKLPEELLTVDEVFRIAQAADNARDRAFILVLYESGCRIGELITLKIKNVQPDQYGAVLRVTGKTGDRRVRIISSAPTLASWLDVYPRAKEPDAPLWPSLATNYKYKGQPAEYQSFSELIKRTAERAGIRKRVYPHLFRHSRATALAGKLTEAQMKEYFGWVQSSEMAATYVHLSGRDVDNAMLALQGMVKLEEKTEEAMKIHICSRCQEKNSPVAKFCLRCGSPMDAQVAMQIDEQMKIGNYTMNELINDKETLEFLFKKAVQLGLDKKLA
ncbi:MAG: tyrosine-type recombinase/integrase [Candidatus Micrarchaeia archaeon]